MFVPVLSASVPLHSKLHQIKGSAATGNQLPQRGRVLLSPYGPYPDPDPDLDRKRRPARYNLGVVVKATRRHRGWETIHCSVHGAVTQYEGQNGKTNTYPDPGIPRRSSRHKRGRAESRKMPTTPREAIVMGRFRAGPPLPAALPGKVEWRRPC